MKHPMKFPTIVPIESIDSLANEWLEFIMNPQVSALVDSELQLDVAKTKLRNKMGNELLNALLTIKFNGDIHCYNFSPTKSMLQKAKNAMAKDKDSESSPSEFSESDKEN